MFVHYGENMNFNGIKINTETLRLQLRKKYVAGSSSIHRQFIFVV